MINTSIQWGRCLAVTLLLLLVAPVVCASELTTQVGEVTVVVGKATSQLGKKTHELHTGETIHEGVTLETGSDGYIYIKTIDHGFISLRPNSRLNIETYRYNPTNPAASKIKLVLYKGVMRNVSGQGAQSARERFRLNTPVAAIGIRGTDFSVFTDATTSRISVRTGGIVMSPFSGDCPATGSGPCKGAGALDLMAGDPAAMLQIIQGEHKPTLLDRKLRHLLPDRIAPPLNDETSRSDNVAKTIVSSTLPTSTSSTEVTVVQKVLDPLTQTQPQPVSTPQIFWGRWQALADLPAGESLDSLLTKSHDLLAVLGPYAMIREPQTGMVIPKAGVYGFQLKSYEAYVINETTHKTVQAQILNPVLTLDFGQQSFKTNFDVKTNDVNHHVYASGSVLSSGKLVGEMMGVNATMTGTLAGAQAEQAGLLFSSRIGSTAQTAVGATIWAR